MSDESRMVERIRTAYRLQGLMRSADLLALCDCVEKQTARAERAEAEHDAAHAVILAVKEWGQVPANHEQDAILARIAIWDAMRQYRVAIGDD